MPSESVMTVRRFMIRTTWHNQHSRPAQQIKQGIAPNLPSRLSKLRRNDMLQLAPPNPRLAQAHFLDQRQNLGLARQFLHLPVAPLVMCLPANSNIAASPRNGQPFDRVLCEDLPKGFFTTRDRKSTRL